MAKQVTPTFSKQLKVALKHFNDVRWLGEHSVLASLYFLGEKLADRPQTAVYRGEALQQQLRLATQQLWGAVPNNREEIEQKLDKVLQSPGTPKYSYFVLELRYLRQFFKPRRMADIWETYLGESRAEFYRDLDHAVEQLGEKLLQNVRPVVRLEQPILPTTLVGRELVQTAISGALQSGQAVSISGAGGMGKSSLGATIFQAWSEKEAFWYTMQPYLNDDATSLLFALAHFLHEHGYSLLWQKLLADNGRLVDLSPVLGLLRADLVNAQKKLLLCIDEVDRLRPPQAEFMLPRHQQLLELIELIKENAPLLLIGQRAIIDTLHHFPLEGVTEANLRHWFTTTEIKATDKQLSRLWRYTGGNPRLIQLMLALVDEKSSLSAVLANLPQNPTLHPLFVRLWTRTTEGERKWLEGLSVYRLPMPNDVWLGETADLHSLLARRLILDDGQGGLTMWPALRDMIYREITLEQQEYHHLQAANARAERGEYTAAAYHFWKGNKPKTAVHVWFPQRQYEIEKGQSQTAISIFENISLAQLNKKEKEALVLIRAELYQLHGELNKANQEVEKLSWVKPSEVRIQAKSLQGYFKSNLGFPEQASQTYDDAIQTAIRIQNQLVLLHTQKGRLFVKQTLLDQALQELQSATIQMLHLRGIIHAEKGAYEQAMAAHNEALALALDVNDMPNLALSHFAMARLTSYQGNSEKMFHHAEQALSLYKKMGNVYHANITQINLAAIYIENKQFNEAIEILQPIISFFEKMNNAYLASSALCNLAESHYELNQLDEAEQAVHRALNHEEAHTMPHAFYTLGMINKKRGNPAAALQALDYSANFAQKNEDIYLLAYIHRGRGEVHHGSQNHVVAKKEVGAALVLFEKLGIENEIEATKALLAAISLKS